MVTDAARDERSAPALDEHRGKWVAMKDGVVVASADDPAEVVRVVEQRGLTGWALDRVPENPDAVFVL